MARCVRPRHAVSGFSLIEISIVLIIIGIIISMGVSLYPGLIKTASHQKDRKLLERAEDALVGYVVANNRLPCPDTDGDGSGDIGATACSSTVGGLPYADVGLSDDRDAYRRSLKYGVYTNGTDNADLSGQSLDFGSLAQFCLGLNNAIADVSANGTDTSQVHVSDGATVANQAFVLASGGFEDLDGDANGEFFDLRNAAAQVGAETATVAAASFEHPLTTQVGSGNTYDDQVLGVGFADLSGRLGCSDLYSTEGRLRLLANSIPELAASETFDVYASGGFGSADYWWCAQADTPSCVTFSAGTSSEAYTDACTDADVFADATSITIEAVGTTPSCRVKIAVKDTASGQYVVKEYQALVN